MKISEKVIDIIKGMEGIGGVPTDQEFLNEFEFRLKALKQGQKLPIDSVSNQRKLLTAYEVYKRGEIPDDNWDIDLFLGIAKSSL